MPWTLFAIDCSACYLGLRSWGLGSTVIPCLHVEDGHATQLSFQTHQTLAFGLV
jgi:hypothetical protein